MCIRDRYTQITGSVGLAGYMTEVMPSGLAEYNAEVTQMIKDAGVMWNGVPAVKSGAIIIGILLGTMTVFIIDKQLHKVAITAVVGYVLACFGFIHSAGLGFNPASPFAIGYLIVAVLAIILHQGRKSWFEGPDDLDVYKRQGVDCAILMNPQTWIASGHLGGFSDPLMDCKECNERFRADKLIEDYAQENGIELEGSVDAWSKEQMSAYIEEHDIKCPSCGKHNFTEIREFNLMFKTFQGVTEDAKNVVYLRPETAQGIFVNFKNVQRT